MRLVLILQNLEFGGTQRQALHIASRLDKKLFSVELWVLCSGGGFVAKAQDLGVPVRFLCEKKTVSVKALFKLARTMKSERPDIVMPMTAVPNIWGRIFGRFFKIPLIIGTCRGGGAISKQWERLLWRMAHHHVCNADSLWETLVNDMKIQRQRVSLIENGIEMPPQREPARVSSESREILSVGRLVADKDFDTLIRAFAMIVEDHPNVRLTLVGDGPLLAQLNELAISLGVAGGITFLPGQSDVESLYGECDLFVLSSVREASPNVVLEAAAAGKPVVATNVGGISKLVIHDETGLLVHSKAPQEMAESLSRLLENPDLCHTMGQAGFAHVRKNFGVNRMVRQYEKLIMRLYSDHRREI